MKVICRVIRKNEPIIKNEIISAKTRLMTPGTMNGSQSHLPSYSEKRTNYKNKIISLKTRLMTPGTMNGSQSHLPSYSEKRTNYKNKINSLKDSADDFTRTSGYQ